MHQAIKWIVAGGVALAAHGGAIAQNTQPGATPLIPPPVAAGPGEVRGPFPAPVGHRQPKPSDLPQDLQNKETRGEQNTRGFDDSKLRICKGC
jgi:hypothetical protein